MIVGVAQFALLVRDYDEALQYYCEMNTNPSVANSEAKYLLLHHVFEGHEYVRVQFTANTLNAQSRAEIEGIGGKFEGVLRNAMILPDGKIRDDAYYSIISKEWPDSKERLRQRIKRKALSQ